MNVFRFLFSFLSRAEPPVTPNEEVAALADKLAKLAGRHPEEFTLPVEPCTRKPAAAKPTKPAARRAKKRNHDNGK